MLKKLLLAAFALGGTAGEEGECSKEEYRAAFGVQPTYELLADSPATPPGIEGNFLVADVQYLTKCKNGGSEFTANFVEKDLGDKIISVLIMSRSEPECTENDLLEDEIVWRGTALAELDDLDRVPFMQQPFSFIAFPPDGEYELMLLDTRADTIQKPPQSLRGSDN